MGVAGGEIRPSLIPNDGGNRPVRSIEKRLTSKLEYDITKPTVICQLLIVDSNRSSPE
jgi:hypothetical protein